MDKRTEILQAHRFIAQMYESQALAALDRGDQEDAQRWVDRLNRADRTTDVHLQLADLEA